MSDREPDVRFPEQFHTSEVDLWLEDGVAVIFRIGHWSRPIELSPDEAVDLGLALVELGEAAGGKATPPEE